MRRRLLLDSEVVDFLERLSMGPRKAIWRRLHEIAVAPDRFDDFPERDSHGRDLSVHVFGDYASCFGTILRIATSRCLKLRAQTNSRIDVAWDIALFRDRHFRIDELGLKVPAFPSSCLPPHPRRAPA